MPTITPNLWFDTEAEEAAEFYCSIFENSKILRKTHYTEAAPRKEGNVMTVEWELDGQRFVGINGGPQFTPNESVSLQVNCKDQDEIDYFWEKLTADGGKTGQCGWVTDKYGFAWQVTPEGIDEYFGEADDERANRVMEVMLKMEKLDVEALRAAADGVTA